MRVLWLGVAVHLWQTTLVLGLLVVLARLLRRAPARYHESLWMAGMVKLLVPLPLLAALWPALRRIGTGVDQEQALGGAMKTLSQLTNPGLLRAPPAAAGSGLSDAALLVATLVWLFGVVALLALWGWRSRVSPPAADVPWHAATEVVDRLSRVARDANVPLNRLRVTDAAIIPYVRNLRRSQIVLSRAVIERLRPEELRAVLIHEDAHRRRGDLWRSAAHVLTACVFFFYPPIWWLKRRLRASAEMACDEAVLAAGVEPGTYARALAETVELGLSPRGATALTGRASSLHDRLQRIQAAERYTTMKRHRLAVAAAFVVALVFSSVPIVDGEGLVAAVGATPQRVRWQEASALSGLKGLEFPVDLRFHDDRLSAVYLELARQAGFDVRFGPDGDFSQRISVAVSRTSVREVLALLAEDTGIEYSVTDPETLVVRFADPTSAGPPGSTPADRSVLLRRYTEAEAQRDGGPMRVGGDIQEPDRIHYVGPEYPELARRARLKGFVIMQATIDKAGNVRDVELLRGLGLGLDEAAVNAVRQWKYTPTLYNGERVEVILTVNVVFQLIK